MSDTWQDVTTVFITALHCPYCLGLRPILIRSEQNGDASQTRKYVCRRCSERFKLVVEPPVADFRQSDDLTL